MFQSFVIADRERGLLFKDGRAVKWLEPGKHRVWGWGRVEVLRFDIDYGFAVMTPELRRLVPDGAADEISVEHGEIALMSIDGRPAGCLLPGRYALWQLRASVTAIAKSTQETLSDVPAAFWPFVPESHLTTLVVRAYERALVYVDGRLAYVLEEGAYGLHTDNRRVETVRVDLREQELQIVGQEVMTADKVSLRLNVAVKFRIVDARKSAEEVTDWRDSLYLEAQMVARRLVAGVTVDELLAGRKQASAELGAELASKAVAWGLEVRAIDVKDVILPGDMKSLMNRVIEAEKQAVANNILRREETAATRSLANTAKVLEQNPTLMRLKELEALRDVAEKVGKLTVVATPGELLSSLRLDRGGLGGSGN